MSDNELSLNTEPYFLYEYVVPPLTVSIDAKFRYNNYFGNGSINGWIQPLPDSDISVSISGRQVDVTFIEGYDPYGAGSDADMFCQYYQISTSPVNPGDVISFHGKFQKVSFMNLMIYLTYSDGTTGMVEVRGEDLPAVSPGLNPYVTGNPSVFAYTDSYTGEEPVHPQSRPPLLEIPSSTLLSQIKFDGTGQIDMFRGDRQTSTYGMRAPDSIEADGCSDYYLSMIGDTTDTTALIMRIKLPDTFVKNSSPDTTYGTYQCNDYTITSYIEAPKPYLNPILDYYAVCSRQMFEHIDENGYAYIFFLPDYYVLSLAVEQSTPAYTPPVVSWGNYTGVALGLPTKNIVIRLRGPSDDWAGSPINATCYLTPEDNQPLNKAELGEWLPELYGDTFNNFNSGHIGIINNDQPWPDPV